MWFRQQVGFPGVKQRHKDPEAVRAALIIKEPVHVETNLEAKMDVLLGMNCFWLGG